MSLIPFILDLADELQEYQRCLIGGVGGGVGCSAMDVDDVDFGLQSVLHEAGTQHTTQQQQQPALQQQNQQQQNEQQRRPRLLSQLYWPSNILQRQQLHHHHQHHRHHPYAQTARLCCKSTGGDAAASIKSNSIAGLANKPTAYPVINKNGWMMVSMNVKQFTPDELIVKTIDNCIIVEGRHEDKEDIHGVISRHFIRKYMLPKGYDPNEVVSTLSSDGILTVKAPPPVPPQADEENTERIVDIQQTGPAQTAVKSATPTPTPTPTQLAASMETEKATATEAAAAEVSLEQPNLPKDNNTTAEEEEEEKQQLEAPLEQPTQIELLETMQMEPSGDVLMVPLLMEEPMVADAATAVEELVPAVEIAAETLAESAKAEMQVDDVIKAAETAESAESHNVNSSAAALEAVPMAAATEVEVAVEVAAEVAATNNGGVVAANDCNTGDDDNEAQLKAKNGIEGDVATDVDAVAEVAATPVIKNTITASPAELPSTLDLAVCVPKSVVIDAAAAAAVKETAAVVDPVIVDEKHAIDANGTNGGSDVVVGDNGLVLAVNTNIDTLPAATAEELVAN